MTETSRLDGGEARLCSVFPLNPEVRRLVNGLKAWSGYVPPFLYHATAAGRFEQFDLSRSNGCVWFSVSLENAQQMARHFAKRGRGDAGYVYVCSVHLINAAVFHDEGEIFALGEAAGMQGRDDMLCAASRILRNEGYDGMVDCYEGRRHSFASLNADAIKIIRVLPV